MKRTIAAIILTFLLTLGLVALALVAVARTGAIDVAAAGDDPPGVEWFFETLSENAIHRQASAAVASGEIVVPELTAAMRASGAAHYGPMCEPCHGGPGTPPGEIGEGMWPEPPDLAHEAEELGEAEIFWVLKHGIRHTGMPAFGATHSDEELWGLVAFVESLPETTPDAYRRVVAAAAGDHGHGAEAAATADAAGGHDHGAHEH